MALLPKYRSNVAASGAAANVIGVTKPAGTAQGDLLVATVALTDAAAAAYGAVTSPGWTQRVVSQDVGNNYMQLVVLSKEAGASEPASYDFTFSRSSNARISLVAYENGADFDASAANVHTSAVTTSTFPTVTAALDGALVIRAQCITQNPPTYGSSSDKASMRANTYSVLALYLGDRHHGAAGAVGTATITHSSAISRTVTVVFTPKQVEGQTLKVRMVTADTDDGYRFSGNFSTSGSNYVGESAGNVYDSFYRFADMALPQGATILEAEFRQYNSGGKFGTPFTNLRMEAADNPSAVTGSTDYSNRAKTSALVAWDNPPEAGNAQYQSPDLSTIIQEVVDRAGWASGNAMQVFHMNDGSSEGLFRVSSYGDAAYSPALLAVAYASSADFVGWGLPMGIA